MEEIALDRTVKQYGGNVPPPGYVQFLIERWPHQPLSSPAPLPFLVWVKSNPRPTMGCPIHKSGWSVSDKCTVQLGGDPGRWAWDVCSCFGKIIE